jgi:isopentenyldiphosphate isomerase
LGLRHRAAHILVFNSQHELLLQKRTLTRDINPGLWDTSAAGHVGFGESYDECARRELAEELGISAPGEFRYLFKLQALPHTGWEFIQVYRANHDGALIPDSREIAEIRWFSPDAVDAWLVQGGEELTISFMEIWRIYRTLEARG